VDKLVEFKWAKYGRAAFHRKLAGAVAFTSLLCVMTVTGHDSAVLHAFAHKAARLLAAWLYLPDLSAMGVTALGGTAPRGASRAACVAVCREAREALWVACEIVSDAFAGPAATAATSTAAAPDSTAPASAAPAATTTTANKRKTLYDNFYRLLAAPASTGWEQVAPHATRAPLRTPPPSGIHPSTHWMDRC
jgi:hypothetical protein